MTEQGKLLSFGLLNVTLTTNQHTTHLGPLFDWPSGTGSAGRDPEHHLTSESLWASLFNYDVHQMHALICALH